MFSGPGKQVCVERGGETTTWGRNAEKSKILTEVCPAADRNIRAPWWGDTPAATMVSKMACVPSCAWAKDADGSRGFDSG